MVNEEKKTCFVIAPIGEPDSDIRKRSDQILKYIIKPVAEACGYEAKRADHISEPGIITTQVIHHVLNDPMVVADLTGRNPNVFYELAIRHALRKPYVQTIQKGEQIPFDVANVRTIEVDHHDLDSVEAAKTEMMKQMRSMQEEGVKVDSPISTAVDMETLRHSGNPEQRQLADVLLTVAELKAKQQEILEVVRGMTRSMEVERRWLQVEGPSRRLSSLLGHPSGETWTVTLPPPEPPSSEHSDIAMPPPPLSGTQVYTYAAGTSVTPPPTETIPRKPPSSPEKK